MRLADHIDLDVSNYIQVALNLTSRCNLSCRYCAVNGGNLQNSDLTPEIINFGYKKIKKLYPFLNIDLNCMGNGEPLLNWEAIRAIDKIRLSDNKIRCFVTTNGTLKNKVLELAKRGWIITISYDGVNNESLRGKTNLVENTIKALKKLNYKKFLIRMTILPGLEDFLEDSLKRLKQLGAKYVILGPVFPLGRYRKIKLIFNLKKIYNSIKYAEKIGLNPVITLQENCTLATRGYYIMPDGRISICYVKYIKPTINNRKKAYKERCLLYNYRKILKS